MCIFPNTWEYANTIKRASERDQYYLGKKEEVIEMYKKKYIPGQELYFKEANPKEKADIIIDNNDFNNPNLDNWINRQIGGFLVLYRYE